MSDGETGKTGLADKLSEQDRKHLASYERKMALFRDRLRFVARRSLTGLFAWGNGGVGKTFQTQEVLREEGVSCPVSNSHMTGKGLFIRLKENPSSVHIIEDCETLFRHKDAVGVLRSALWGSRADGDSGVMERRVCWTTSGWGDGTPPRHDSFIFSGGIVLLANSALPQTPECAAMAGRIRVMHLDLTEDEVIAKMRETASRGFEYGGLVATPDEAEAVCEHVVDLSLSMGRRLDLRALHHGLVEFAEWKAGGTESDWRDLVRSGVAELTTWCRHPVRARKTLPRHEMVRIVSEIVARTPAARERLTLWEELTGLGRASFYRQLRSIEAN
jgi:hypothetical protein